MNRIERIELPTVGEYDLNVMHRLLEFSLMALEKFEATPGCAIDMDLWYARFVDDGKSICYACLGGATVIQMAGIDTNDGNFWGLARRELTLKHRRIADGAGVSPDAIIAIERALNNARYGNIWGMFSSVGHVPPGTPNPTNPNHGMLPLSVDITAYCDDPVAFKQDMKGLMQLLKDACY